MIRNWHAARNEKPFEKSNRAIQHVHCSRLRNNSACTGEQCGDKAAWGFLQVTLASCRVGEEHWDEACLQERAYFSAEMVHIFLLGVAERSGLTLSREEGCS